jgi:D-alanine-D-alanine ligase
MNIAVLYGGFSTEREVSLKSGQNVATTLQNIGHQVILVDVITALEWKIGTNVPTFFTNIASINPDLIFNALHGQFGEDGQVQSLLDILKIPYTGSGQLSSALAINKAKCYEILEKFDIDTPKTYEITNAKELEYLDLPFPLFVKPNDGGSSICSGLANSQEELFQLVEAAQKVSNLILVQEMIVGQELTCPVLGTGGHSYALPIGSIESNHKFLDYEAKYEANDTIETFPAVIDEDKTKKIQEMSVEIHRLLNCKGITRSDFIMTTDRIVFLEINTSPGMTDRSFCPKSAASAGLNFEQLLTKIINDALN